MAQRRVFYDVVAHDACTGPFSRCPLMVEFADGEAAALEAAIQAVPLVPSGSIILVQAVDPELGEYFVPISGATLPAAGIIRARVVAPATPGPSTSYVPVTDKGLTNVKVYYRKQDIILAGPICSYEDLMDGLMANWKLLQRIDFDIELLPHGKAKRGERAVVSFELSNSRQWEAFMAKERPSTWALNIKTDYKGFSEYTYADFSRVLNCQLGCSADTDLALHPHADRFPELHEDKVMAAADKEPDFSLDKLTELTVQRLRLLSMVLPTIRTSKEKSRREYISAIFASAVSLASIVHGSETHRLLMVCEMNLQGTLGNGPLDYAAVFRSLIVLVLEAKVSMLDGEGQVVAQMAAALDDFVFKLTAVSNGPIANRKRKAFEITDMSEVTCSAVLTDAATWRLMRYEPGGESGQSKFWSSEGITLNLDQPEQLSAICRKLISRIAHMLVSQMKQIDAAFARRPNLEAASQTVSQAILEEDE